MYIKKVKKRNPGAKKFYEYLHLVENIRTEKGPRQQLILNLGTLDVPPEQYKALATCIETMLAGQQLIFRPDEIIAGHARKAVNQIIEKRSQEQVFINGLDTEPNRRPEYRQVDVASLEASDSRSLGPEYVCHSIWNELGLNDLLLSKGVSPHTLKIIETLVLGRLIFPASERQTWEWAQHRSAVYELTGKPVKWSLSAFYRASDILLRHKDAIEAHLSKKEKEIFSLTETICLYDLTNAHFEGQLRKNPKAKFGHAKQKRFDCKLLTLALIVDADGFVKCSRMYPGNQAETKTLSQMIESLVALRPDLAVNPLIIMDAGIASDDNLAWLKARGYHYIVVNRGKSAFIPDDAVDMVVIRKKDDVAVEVKRKEQGDEALLLVRSSGRVEKDTSIRSRQEQLFVEKLEYYRNGLSKKGRTKAYPKILELIGRLREKYPRASKVYTVEVIPEKGTGTIPKTLLTKDISWHKKTAFETAEALDGCYVLRTDRVDLSDKEIWETYIMLSRVESAFRSLKSSLGLRPNFHQIERRGDAHMFISVLAYHILNAIEYRLRQHGDHRCWDTIRQVLSTHQRLSIEYDVKEQEQIRHCYLRICSRPEQEHCMIYHKLGLLGDPLGRLSYTPKNL